MTVNSSYKIGKMLFVNLALTLNGNVGKNVTLAAISGYTAFRRADFILYNTAGAHGCAYIDTGSNAIITLNAYSASSGTLTFLTGTIILN